jgi:hypothetical protein
LIQTKQMNLQNMLVGRSSIDSSKANIREGLRDATIAIPAGTAGALVYPGTANGTAVMNACLRATTATRFEKLFSSGAATTGAVTAEVLVIEGLLSVEEVHVAMGW